MRIAESSKRWLPTVAMMLLSLLSYVDRNVLALLSHTILREASLSTEQYGWIISAFSIAYLVGNPVWGRILDRVGVRVGLFVSVTFWTCASATHAFALSAWSFALARAALGFGEGATFPGGLRTAAQTLRADQRGRGVALAYSGGSLGAIATPILVTPIALRWGWRSAFLFTGLLGLAWLALWAWVSTDERLAAPSKSDAAAPAPSLPPDARAPAPTLQLRDTGLWAFMAAYAFGGLPLGFVLYQAPIYLSRVLGCDQATLGRVLWIPPLGWEVGYFFWGAVVDRAARAGGARDRRYAPLLLALGVLGLPLLLATRTHDLVAVMALFFFAMFVSSGFVIVSLSETTRTRSEEHGAFLAGLGAGAWSLLMTVAMPYFGRLADHGAFGVAHAIAAVCPLLGALGWWALGGGRPPPAPNARGA